MCMFEYTLLFLNKRKEIKRKEKIKETDAQHRCLTESSVNHNRKLQISKAPLENQMYSLVYSPAFSSYYSLAFSFNCSLAFSLYQSLNFSFYNSLVYSLAFYCVIHLFIHIAFHFIIH